jgi:hypothetical protein
LVNTAEDTAAIEVDAVENINVTFRTFTDNVAFDATNVSGATITVSSPLSGFSSTVDVDGAGENNIVAGEGVGTLTVNGYDEGLITVGDGVNLIVANDSDTVNLDISGEVEFSAESSGEYANVNVTGASGSTLTWSATATIQELVLDGDFTFVVGGVNLDGEVVIDGSAATLEIFSGELNLTDVDVASIQVGGEGEAVGITNAEGKTVTITAAEADVTMDAGEDGGELTIDLQADGATLDLGAANADSATVVVDSAVETILGLTTATTLTIETATSGDVTFDAEGEGLVSGEETVTITGAGAVTINSFAGSTLDATAATGAIDVTLANAGATIELGKGADTLTLGAEATGDVTAMTYDGADTLNLELFGGDSYYVDGGAGNDTFILATAEGATTGTATDIIIAGGAGTDTARVTLDAEFGAVDFSGADTFTLSGIEVLNVVGSAVETAGETTAEIAGEADLTLAAATLDGLTLSITGSSAADQVITVNMGAEGTDLDMSGVTVATAIETLIIDFSTGASAEDAIVATTTSRADLVVGPADVAGFDINLSGGADEFNIGAVGGELALGSGDDTVMFNGDGVAIDAEDNATGVVVISDFSNSTDVIFDTLGTGIAADLITAEATDVSAADAEGEASDIVAVVADGVVTLVGDDSDVIDTVEEWIGVIEAINAAGIFAFEFESDTYVVNADTAGAVTDAVQLVGVSGLTLSDGSDTDLITISS